MHRAGCLCSASACMEKPFCCTDSVSVKRHCLWMVAFYSNLISPSLWLQLHIQKQSRLHTEVNDSWCHLYTLGLPHWKLKIAASEIKNGVRRELELLSLKEKKRRVIVSLLPPDAVSLLLSSSIAHWDLTCYTVYSPFLLGLNLALCTGASRSLSITQTPCFQPLCAAQFLHRALHRCGLHLLALVPKISGSKNTADR